MVSNQEVLLKSRSQNQKCTVPWLKGMDPNSAAADSSYRTAIMKCESMYRNLKKSKQHSELLETFLGENFKFPIKSTNSRTQKPKDPVACEGSCSYVEVSYDLASEVNDLRTENITLKNEIETLKQSKVSRAAVKGMKSEIKNQKRLLSCLERRLKKKNADLKRLRLRLSRSETKTAKIKQKMVAQENDNDGLRQLNERLDVSVKEKEEELKSVIEDKDYLQDILNTEQGDTLNCYDSDAGKYTYELRECIYSLLGLNVPASNVARVINSVLTLVNKKVEKLPSRSTILNMNVERLVLSQKQLNETLTDQQNLTLYTDETTKFGTKYSGYHVSDTSGNTYVLGMREMVTKSGADTLATFQQILRDIEERTEEANQTAKKVLGNITATMSDRASTEKRFNALLEELRTSILPDLKENWDDLTHEDQTAASSMLNFFCGLHGLVHFADCANKSVIEVQNGLFENAPIYDTSFMKSTESGALRLTRTACKALARGADEKNGKYSDFNIHIKEFLKENNMCSLPLAPFKGNRFNILFESAAAVFFLHKKIKEFLEDNQSNNLLKSVLHDINTVEYLAGVKALGLISRFVTGPLWVLLEDKNVHVYDMNEHYVELIVFLYEAVEDIDLFMSGEMELYNAVQKDAIHGTLIQDWEHNHLVAIYLNVMLPAMAECAKKMYADHLPGGKWEDVTPEMRCKAQSVQKHNKFAESVFGYLDNLLRRKPNISVLASEAYIMFTSNKTGHWIESKTEQEKETLINEAMKESSAVQASFKRRKVEIQEKVREGMAERARLSAEKEARRVQKMSNYTSDIIHFGLWQSETDLDSALLEIVKKKDQIEALKAQLHFRKNVFKQVPDLEDLKHVYRFSKTENGQNKKLNVQELRQNVLKLIQHAYTIDTTRGNETETRRALLTGKLVEHKFVTAGQEAWWRGTVVSQVPGYPTWYNIVYEGDAAVYSYQLMTDYEKGDLRLLVH